MPAEILRETDSPPPPPAPPEPEAPTPRATPFDALSSQIQSVYGGVLGARGEQQAGLERKAAAVNPRLTAVQTASDDFAKQIQTQRAELEASKPQITRPPSRGLSQYLAPHEGESPEASVGKLISGLTMFATGLGGLAKGDATAGLAAFKGALEGWHAGDKERADRAFADWKAKTDAALKQWEVERTSYLDWIEAGNMSLDQMLKGAELEAIKHDNGNAAKAFQTGTMEAALGFLQQERNHADSVAATMARLTEAKANQDENRRVREKEGELNRENKLEFARIMAQQKEKAEEDKLDAVAMHPAYDYKTGIVRQITKREEQENAQDLQAGKPAKLRSLPPQQVQLLERLAVAPPILDRLDELIDKINAAAPGENITQGLINRLKRRAGISADMQEIMTLNLDNALENAAALSGGQPRIAILNMLRGEATPNEFMTAETAHRAVATTRTTIYNRGQTMTGDPDTITKMAKELRGYGGPKGAAKSLTLPDGTVVTVK